MVEMAFSSSILIHPLRHPQHGSKPQAVVGSLLPHHSDVQKRNPEALPLGGPDEIDQSRSGGSCDERIDPLQSGGDRSRVREAGWKTAVWTARALTVRDLPLCREQFSSVWRWP